MENNQINPIQVSDIKISERTAKLIEARGMIDDAWCFVDELFTEREEEGDNKRKPVCTPGYFDTNLKESFQKIHEHLTYCLEDSVSSNREASDKTII